MKARLFGRTGALEGFEVGFEDRLEIGRDERCGATLQLASISSRHARIEWDAEREGFYLEDLDSRNGTWLDGLRVTRRERLGRLSIVTLAEEHDLVFQNLSECEERSLAADLEPVAVPLVGGGARPVAGAAASQRPAAQSAAHPARPAAPVSAAPVSEKATVMGDAPPPPLARAPAAVPAAPTPARSIALEVAVAGPARVIPLHEGENVVGRVPGAKIVLEDSTVSRRHAVLSVDGEIVRIRDEGSRNKTFVEGEPLEPGVERTIDHGASLRFGTVEARLTIRH